jgi:hypothetical protein
MSDNVKDIILKQKNQIFNQLRYLYETKKIYLYIYDNGFLIRVTNIYFIHYI